MINIKTNQKDVQDDIIVQRERNLSKETVERQCMVVLEWIWWVMGTKGKKWCLLPRDKCNFLFYHLNSWRFITFSARENNSGLKGPKYSLPSSSCTWWSQERIYYWVALKIEWGGSVGPHTVEAMILYISVPAKTTWSSLAIQIECLTFIFSPVLSILFSFLPDFPENILIFLTAQLLHRTAVFSTEL